MPKWDVQFKISKGGKTITLTTAHVEASDEDEAEFLAQKKLKKTTCHAYKGGDFEWELNRRPVKYH